MTIRYTISLARPYAHIYHVRCTVPHPEDSGQRFSLPAWIPGSYMIRDFAKNVGRVSANSDGQAVTVSKVDKQTWLCEPCAGSLELEYEVYAWDLSVRGAHFDATHAYFNGTSVFMYVEGRATQRCEVEIRRPEGESYADWRVATSLPRAGAAEWGFGTYTAADYDALVDHPVEIGTFAQTTFTVAGVPHHVALYGRHQADLTRLCTDLEQICTYHVRLFGELPDMERYLFLVTVVGDGYGGLEHRASCSLMTGRDSLPRTGEPEINDAYRDFLALCSHEYFHTWNVKRIKPAAFLPYDLRHEVHTKLLWAFEGITSYYDELALYRAGLISAESYLEMVSQAVTRVLRTPGRFKQSVAESSFDAWTKFYKQDENAPNAIISYYAKGAVIALALDLMLRRDSGGKVSLDDLLRAMWQTYGRQDIGVPEDGIFVLVSEMAGAQAGQRLRHWVEGTDDPDLAELLASFGVEMHVRGADSAKDKGGKPSTRDQALLVLGVRLANDGDSARLAVVLEGSGAAEAGLSAGDELIAIDGIRVNGRTLEGRLQRYAPGDTVNIHGFRRDELWELPVQLRPAPADTCYMKIVDEGRCRKQWLNGGDAAD